MKARHVLWFILSCIAGLAILGLVFPRDGINILGFHLEFPHPTEVIIGDTITKIDVEETIKKQTNYMSEAEVRSHLDSIRALKDFAQNSPSRLHYPDDNREFFYPLFEDLTNAKRNKKIIRFVHYGDSQIEIDRISEELRESFQEIFGGSGPGMIPAIQTIPTRAVSQDYSGDLHRYTIYGNVESRANHNRYGGMALVTEVEGSATINIRTRVTAKPRAKSFNTVKVLLGNCKPGFKCYGKAGYNNLETKSIDTQSKSPTLLEWTLPKDVSSATLNFEGNGEIYGIILEADHGVSVDNIPMRGCSGTIFTRMDSLVLSQSLQKANTRLIIMQYGGNVMPVVNNEKKVDWFGEQIAKQITFLQNVCPESQILFIGPSDMSTNIKGSMLTRPFLIDVNNKLKETALKNGAAYWDMFSAMGGENSMSQWVNASPPLASSDYIHFTQLGADKIGEMLFVAFNNDYTMFKISKKVRESKNKKQSISQKEDEQ
ncbi:MAG: hypothetical protein ACOXZK_10550 [Bacteroidales bacterium]|mgnify:CR=1 FL=1